MADVIVEHVGKKREKDINPRWWALDKNKKYESLFPLLNSIENKQGYRRTGYIRNARLYSNLDLYGVGGSVFSQSANEALPRHRVTLNVIKSCIDTAASKIAKNKIRITYLTDGGDWTLQRRAADRSKFINTQFLQTGLYNEQQRAFVDSCVFGTGAVKIYREGKHIKAERVIIDELWVDDGDGIYGRPSQLFQVKLVSRDSLKEMFPEFEDEIDAASSGLTADMSQSANIDLIRVVEAWKLPSSKDSEDGHHAISIETADLLDEPYKKQYFPFLFPRWNYKITGFYGQGLAEELVGIQLEINKVLYTIQRATHLFALPRVWIDEASVVNAQTITNEVGSIGKYRGQPPLFMVSQVMPPETYQYVENLYNKAFQITGISQLSAQSKKPSGLDSAVALREFQDIESERFQLVGQRYEESFLEAAKMFSDLNAEIQEEFGKLTIRTESGKFVEEISWKDCKLDDEEGICKIFPVSALPSSPPGRLAKVQEMTQAGFFSMDEAKRLLDFPDLDSVNSLENAAFQDTMRMIEFMVDKGEYFTPEPYMNLTLALKLTQMAYLKYRMQKVPEERLELLRQFIDECANLMQVQAPMQQALGFQPPTPQGQPQLAQPEALPTSDLMAQGAPA